MSDRTEFMGMIVEGDGHSVGWSRLPQQPIENLYEEMKAAFAQGVQGVMWEQYTPGWNDGESCEFTIQDAKVTLNKVVAEAWLDGTEPDMELAYPGEDTDYDAYDYELWGSHPDGPTVKDISIPVDDGKYEDALRYKFGNDVKIIVTPNRVVTEVYDCGY